MLDVDAGLEISIDLAVFLGAAYAGLLLAPRVRGTRLWFPLLFLFGGACIFAGADTLMNLTAAGGDFALASDLTRTSQMGIGVSIPALVNLVAVYPRNVRSPVVRAGVVTLYVVGFTFAVLAPTHLLIEQVAPDPTDGIVSYGVAYWPLLLALTASLAAALGWTLFLAIKGAAGFERKTSMRLSAMVGGPLVLGAAAQWGGMARVGSLDVITVSFASWMVAIGWIIRSGRLRPPTHSTFYGLLNSVSDAIFIVDREGRVVTVNREAERFLGIPYSEVSYTPLRDLLVPRVRRPEDVGILDTAVRGIVRGRMDSHEGLLEGPDPERRTYRYRVQPIGPDEGRGEADAALVTLRDETKRRADERATASSRDVLDLVIRMLGHDLKAPITVVQGYIDLDKARVQGAFDAKTAAAVRSDLDKMSEALVGMQVLMGNARALSRLAAVGEELALTEVDLTRLVRQAVDMVKPVAAARQVTLEGEAADGVRALVVPGFDSVPRNLLDNAVKYTPPGGTVKASLTAAGGQVVLVVADTGPGIPPEKLDLLFRKFERLGAEKGPQEGHGLGLSIVAKLVELSKGTIAVEDRPDGKSGAVFRVQVPQSGAAK